MHPIQTPASNALAIQQIVMRAELAVNRALDRAGSHT
jgi:hypothetical protein